ncbi:hypothetical protein YYC_05726 [Plasmodium yoelii 17X]|uniref:Heptatricopeptide repeat-containing protein, putative n=2 Tax=Plasmodium yoelii TaxID=5861 RepID=A0A078KG60_PLAYE|nr:heptatricopeptide repeat-containing protein, putative [Plasmodium yoelii]ETB56290.1 hypothetical protein YYC_05726 [Plasmodium yoelii 17X]CDU19730.1 conserved Plasmodium protein, unknown function [Plasmodium yoelii]VTZ80487.1 heptatricopeptide repeat-containing protein, putative [Plasmodium yoelii]|eukprot:XP_022813507.1 heptatricopeptide repeat-containing protein, putative [Plasmodium yoelii]
MKRLLKNAIIDIKKIKYDGDKKLSNAIQENIKPLIIKNAHKFENEEILKIIEKYNQNNCKDDQILKCSYDVFKNNVHRYSFDQINRILRLYNKSQINDNNFNTSIFNYIVKRLNAIPLPITVNMFNNLIRCQLRDYKNIDIIKDYFVKNIDNYNALDLTIILSSFTMLQEEIIMKSTNLFDDEKKDGTKLKNPNLISRNYNEIILLILNKIKNDENIHNNLSVINSILILNMISKLNINDYELFKMFTKKYYKKLKEQDVEPHHLTLLLNTFAKCNININILKYIIKYMNNDNFVNQLSYVNIANAVHYMAKFNYNKNTDFLNRLKNKIIQIIDTIPQREFSNIMWSLSKLKVKDDRFYFFALEKTKKIVHLMDMMSIAQVLDALRRRKHFSSDSAPLQNTMSKHSNDNTIQKISNIHNNSTKLETNLQNQELNHVRENEDIFEEKENNSDEKKEISSHKTEQTKNELTKGSSYDSCNISEEFEKEVIDLLIKKYLENIGRCSLHVLTQVPFCSLQLNCTNYDVYHKSLDVLKKNRAKMTTINLIYARYFIRILIEKQENNFQKLPRSLKQFAKEIMNSDNN